MFSAEYVNTNNAMLRDGWSVAQWHCARTINPPVHPAAVRQPMPQYYALPDQRRIERVPRPPLLSPPDDTFPAITFGVSGWAGVRVKDILRDIVIIDAANDTVLAHHGWRSIIVNLKCGKFGDLMRSKVDVHPDGRDITRQNLAQEICGLLFSFHKIVSKHSISTESKKWALTSGPEGIRVLDIVLFSVHYYRNTWVPEFYVIE